MEVTYQIYKKSFLLGVCGIVTGLLFATSAHSFVAPSVYYSSSDVESESEQVVVTDSTQPQTETPIVSNTDVKHTTTVGLDCTCDAVQSALTEVRASRESCRDAVFLVDAHAQKVLSIQQAVDRLTAIVDQIQEENLNLLNNNKLTTHEERTGQSTHAQDDVERDDDEYIVDQVQVEVPSSLRGVTFVRMDEPDVLPRDCREVQMRISNTTGVYTILPDGCGQPFQVYCDMYTSGGGWTVLQRRQDGSLSFDQTWGSYRRGFGNLLSEFWLGLDKMNRLTVQDEYELRIDLLSFNGSTATAEYELVRINDYWANFRLNIGEFKANGSAGDSLSYHNSMPFSTSDRDNDLSTANCAELYPGGWWHNQCHYSNLNGHYLEANTDEFATGVVWYEFGGFYNSLKFSEMKVRPV